MNIVVRKPTEEEVARAAADMHPRDVDEAWAMAHVLPLEALQTSIRSSREAFCAFVEDRPAALFGVSSFEELQGNGSPWALMTNEMSKPGLSLLFARCSVLWMREQKQKWSYLENYVDVRNKKAVAWIRWLGFEMGEEAPYGPDQQTFIRFWWGLK